MPISIDTLRSRVATIVNNIQQGRLRNAEFNTAVNTAQDNLFKERIGFPEQQNPQDLKTRFGRTRKLHHDLRPFVKEVTLSVPSSGKLTYPPVADYQIFEALRKKMIVRRNTAEHRTACNSGTVIESNAEYDTFLIHVKFIEQSKWAKRSQSVIVPPNKFKPVFTFSGANFEFAPRDIGKVLMVYLKTPQRARWAYTIDPTTNVDVYDAANSVDLEWDAMLLDEIANRVADVYLGNVKDVNGQQVVRQKIMAGE